MDHGSDDSERREGYGALRKIKVVKHSHLLLRLCSSLVHLDVARRPTCKAMVHLTYRVSYSRQNPEAACTVVTDIYRSLLGSLFKSSHTGSPSVGRGHRYFWNQVRELVSTARKHAESFGSALSEVRCGCASSIWEETVSNSLMAGVYFTE